MAWQDIEDKLKRALTVKISFPGGTIWLPESRLSIDDWLESIAETDEELREIEIPRIRFLQNRWPIDELVELEWEDESRVISAMYVGRRAYIFFSDQSHYLVIAALEPSHNPALYRAVAGKILENRNFVPRPAASIRNHRPDLIPEVAPSPKGDWEELVESRPVFGEPAPLAQFAWKGFLSEVLVGWIGKWLNLPELGFWHEEMPQSITRTNEGEILMKYRRGSGDGGEKDRRRAS
jgi:hypothetical protein